MRLRDKDVLTPEEFQKLVQQLSVRDGGMVLLIGSTGLRRKEMIALNRAQAGLASVLTARKTLSEQHNSTFPGHYATRAYGIMSRRDIYAMATNNLTLEQYIGVSQHSALDLAEIAEKGLPTNSIAYLKEKGLTFSEVSEIVISPRTLKHRKARGEPLSVEETERMLRVARILSLADQVFASHEKALTWLRQFDERLNGRTPLSMLHTESGGRLVENLLWQIDEGVYS